MRPSFTSAAMHCPKCQRGVLQCLSCNTHVALHCENIQQQLASSRRNPCTRMNRYAKNCATNKRKREEIAQVIDTTFPNADKDEETDIVTKASHADDDSILSKCFQSVYSDSYCYEGEMMTASKTKALYVEEEASRKADQYVNGFDGFDLNTITDGELKST